MSELPYRWVWQTRLAARRGQLFRVVCRGAMNSCLIEFGDGWRCVTSRNALRKADAPRAPPRAHEEPVHGEPKVRAPPGRALERGP